MHLVLFMNQTQYKNNTDVARSAWAGLMVGDALGAPAEFCYSGDIRAKYPYGLSKMVNGFGICVDRVAGEITDDTQMAYCLHCSLEEAGDWDAALAFQYYREWLATDPPDVGVATEAALSGSPMLESQGNGALMRVMPIALWALQNPEFDWMTAACEDAALTHPHPICAECNVVYVYALLQAAKRDASSQSIYEATLIWAKEQEISSTVIDTLMRASTERPDYDGEHIGWVLIALQSAFYQLLHAPSFKDALVDIVSAGGDTDTNAAIAGALLGILYGVQAIPRDWIEAVHKANLARYTSLLPSSLFSENNVALR